MTRLTIPAREVREGDRLTGVGGISVYGAYPYSNPERPGHTILYLWASVDDLLGSIALPDDALVEVDRTDPDAELIERIAQAIAETDSLALGDWSEITIEAGPSLPRCGPVLMEVGCWSEITIEGKAEWRRMARAALAIVRAEQ